MFGRLRVRCLPHGCHWTTKTYIRRRAVAGAAVAEVHQASDCRRLRNFYTGTVCGSGPICRSGSGWQRNRRDDRAQSRKRSGECGRIHKAAGSEWPLTNSLWGQPTQTNDRSLLTDGRDMDIAAWRRKIDEIDRKLVEMLNQRAEAAQEIGRLKRATKMPIYEPDRERIVLDQVQEANQGPLQHRHLMQIYERIMDVMRNIQKDEIVVD